jgi:hypothetical protein
MKKKGKDWKKGGRRGKTKMTERRKKERKSIKSKGGNIKREMGDGQRKQNPTSSSPSAATVQPGT